MPTQKEAGVESAREAMFQFLHLPSSPSLGRSRLLRRLRVGLKTLGRRVVRQLRQYAQPRHFCPDDLREDVGLPPLPKKHERFRGGV